MKYRLKVSTENRLFLVTRLLRAFDIRLNGWEDSTCSRHKSLKSKKQMVLRIFNLSHQIKMIHMYTGCPRRNGQNFGREFLMLNYTDITQNTYIQSWTVTEIMAIEKYGILGCPRTVRRPWRHTHPLRMPGNETPLVNIAMQWPWRDNEQLRPV